MHSLYPLNWLYIPEGTYPSGKRQGKRFLLIPALENGQVCDLVLLSLGLNPRLPWIYEGSPPLGSLSLGNDYWASGKLTQQDSDSDEEEEEDFILITYHLIDWVHTSVSSHVKAGLWLKEVDWVSTLCLGLQLLSNTQLLENSAGGEGGGDKHWEAAPLPPASLSPPNLMLAQKSRWLVPCATVMCSQCQLPRALREPCPASKGVLGWWLHSGWTQSSLFSGSISVLPNIFVMLRKTLLWGVTEEAAS